MNTYQKQRAKEISLIQQRIQEQQIRLKWSRSEILAQQEKKLRDLLSHAKKNSSWHRARLAAFDVENFKLEQLTRNGLNVNLFFAACSAN